jgi:hypothetical protein
VAGLGGDHRPARRTSEAGSEVRVEGDGAGDGLRGDGERRPVAVGAVVRLPLDRLHEGRKGLVGRRTRVEPGGHERRDGVGAVGLDGDAAEGGALTGDPGLLVGRERGHGVGQHRVAPVLHAGGAGVVGLARELEAPPSVRPDPAGQSDGHVAVDEVAALLDVELDEGADPVEVHQAARRVQSGGADRVGEEDAVPVAELLRLLPRRGAGDQPRAEAGAPEPRPLLLDEDADADRAVRLEAPGPQGVDGCERGRHAQRAVVRTAVEDRVEVRPGEHPRGVGKRAGRGLPPGDLVADAVGLHDQPARRALLGEP